MPFDGNGNWTSTFYPIDDRNNSIPILASKFNELIQNNLKQSFASCMTIDSQTKPITNVDVNNFKVINVADATLPKDAVNKQTFESLKENNFRVGDNNNIAVEKDVAEVRSILGLPIDYIKDNLTYVNSTDVTWYGVCRSDDNITDITVDISTPVTAVLSDAPINATRHMFVGFNNIDVVVAEFDSNADGSGLSNITGAKRRVLSIKTDGLGGIINFISKTKKDGSLKVIFDSTIRNNSSTSANTSYQLIDTACPDGVDTIWNGLIRAQSLGTTSGSRTCGVYLNTPLKSNPDTLSYRVLADRLYGVKRDNVRINDLYAVNGQIWYQGVNINAGGDHYVEQGGYIDERIV